jgi:hypothetical protein
MALEASATALQGAELADEKSATEGMVLKGRPTHPQEYGRISPRGQGEKQAH